jgi:predicted membrane chloride channel (bestrophin family)
LYTRYCFMLPIYLLVSVHNFSFSIIIIISFYFINVLCYY